jgi:putative addiction module component (TIGR02574 family)
MVYRPAMAVSILSYDRLEEEVLHLPRGDRSKLVSRLLESLDEEAFELGPEWREELQRRVSHIDTGKAKLIPAEDLWKEVNQSFGTKF